MKSKIFSREREDARRREKAWASLNATAMKNPLYNSITSGDLMNGCDDLEQSNGSLMLTSKTVSADPPSPSNPDTNLVRGRSPQNGISIANSDSGKNGDAVAILENDDDVNASLRSLQQESEEEVCNYASYSN